MIFAFSCGSCPAMAGQLLDHTQIMVLSVEFCNQNRRGIYIPPFVKEVARIRAGGCILPFVKGVLRRREGFILPFLKGVPRRGEGFRSLSRKSPSPPFRKGESEPYFAYDPVIPAGARPVLRNGEPESRNLGREKKIKYF